MRNFSSGQFGVANEAEWKVTRSNTVVMAMSTFRFRRLYFSRLSLSFRFEICSVHGDGTVGCVLPGCDIILPSVLWHKVVSGL